MGDILQARRVSEEVLAEENVAEFAQEPLVDASELVDLLGGPTYPVWRRTQNTNGDRWIGK